MKITSIDIFKAIVESPTPGWFPICVRVKYLFEGLHIFFPR